MAGKTKQPSKRFKLKVEKTFLSARNDIEALEILGRLLRTYETTKSRLEGYIKFLRKKLRDLVRDLNIQEHIFGRTHLKRIDVWGIPKDKKGEVIYQKFVETFGQERAKEWIELKKEEIPAETVMTYNISEEKIQEITDLGLASKAQDIIGRWYIKVGPISKRAKEGKPMKRQKKKK
jgi:hypothetical protein